MPAARSTQHRGLALCRLLRVLSTVLLTAHAAFLTAPIAPAAARPVHVLVEADCAAQVAEEACLRSRHNADNRYPCRWCCGKRNCKVGPAAGVSAANTACMPEDVLLGNALRRESNTLAKWAAKWMAFRDKSAPNCTG